MARIKDTRSDLATFILIPELSYKCQQHHQRACIDENDSPQRTDSDIYSDAITVTKRSSTARQ
jgi:hypothetical protein